MKAIRLALCHFKEQTRGKSVLIQSDNATFIFNLNRQVGKKSLSLLWESKIIINWEELFLCILRAVQK